MNQKRKSWDQEKLFAYGCIWGYGPGYFKAYTDVTSVRRRLLMVTDGVFCNTYFNPTGWDFVFPVNRLQTVIKLLKNGDQPRKLKNS